MKIYYDFSQFLNCSCEIYFEANLRLIKGCVISLKRFHGNLVFLTWHTFESANSVKKHGHHPKLMYKIFLQNGHEQFNK